MKPRDFVLAQINHRETHPVPYSLWAEEDVARRLDEHYGSAEWRSRLSPYLATFSFVDSLAFEAIDETYSRDAFGGIWRLDMRPWQHVRPPLATPSLSGFEYPELSTLVKPELKDQARQWCEQNKDKFLMADVGWGIWQLCFQIRGYAESLMDAAAEPAFIEELLERNLALLLDSVDMVAGLPFDAVFFGEDWGNQRGVDLGPERWRKLLKRRWAQAYEAVHAQGKLTVSHCCGSVADIMPDIIEAGLDVLESVQPEAAGMDPYGLKRKYGEHITFWGGLGSQSTIPFGTPAEIRAEVRRLYTEMGQGGGYILAPAKELMLETPTENAVAVFEAFTEQEPAGGR